MSHSIIFIQSFYCSLVMEHDYSLQFAATSVAEAFHVKRKHTGQSNDQRRLSDKRRDGLVTHQGAIGAV